MPLRAFRGSVLAVVLAVVPAGAASTFAAVDLVGPAGTAVAATGPAAAAPPQAGDPPPVTVNPFLPDDRGISECISALPKPGCGSEARGGWRQGLVLLALMGGLAVIGWRIVAGARRGRPSAPGPVGTPDGTPRRPDLTGDESVSSTRVGDQG